MVMSQDLKGFLKISDINLFSVRTYLWSAVYSPETGVFVFLFCFVLFFTSSCENRSTSKVRVQEQIRVTPGRESLNFIIKTSICLWQKNVDVLQKKRNQFLNTQCCFLKQEKGAPG